MPQDRRAFEQLPDYLKTTQNNREFWIADDPLYEPERADFVIGWVGDTSVLSEEDLERTPPLSAPTAERQRYQLSIGTTYIDPQSQTRLSGAFYQDLVGQIEANGGIVGDDPNRVFETRFYSWAPPMDFDKHVNFGRYFWVGDGAADVNGEYVTKEPAGSRTVLYEWTGTAFEVRVCQLVNGLPASATAGDYAEDASSSTRRIFRYDGTQWVGVDFVSVEVAPEDTSDFEAGDHVYVARTGPDFNRPIIWRYTQESGRWHPLSVVVRTDQPDFVREGMLWEDSSIGTERIFKRYENGFWVPLTYTVSDVGPTGIGQDDEYVYDIRDYDTIGNDWSDRNWWRHIEDLSPADRENLKPEDQATRPIIEFWHGLEQVAGDVRDERNDSPVFQKYAFDPNVLDIVNTSEGTTVYEYQRGTGQDDFVLGFPLSFNQSGEFIFELTLESDTSTFEGYKFVKDTITGLVHSVWHKSVTPLMQEQDENGFWSLPKSMTSNPDHVTLTEISRSRYLRHFGSIIESQDGFSGAQYGPNSWRWSRKDPALGATIIDNEQSLLRALAMLQTTQFNLPDAIRQIEKEYNRILFKFGNTLNQMWNENTFNDVGDSLLVSAEDACDAVLTRLFLGRTPDFPFYYSDMGTFVQKRVFNGNTVDVLDPEAQPIYVPPSAPRVGTAKAYEPAKFTDRDGQDKLRGHDGSLRDAFGDDRDLVWLELETRFYNAIPVDQRTETDTFSGRFLSSNFFLQDYYGNYIPTTSIEPVDRVVPDYREILTPAANERVFSTFQGEFATFAGGTGTLSSGGTWLTRKALTDDVFLNNEDGEYYIFNGLGTFVIERWNRSFEFDYSDNEFKRIIRREFERWAITAGLDFMTNDTFVQGDRFTWNYGSAGIEGHYKGQYRRLYNTVRPHSHPWEVVGYSIEPTWWRTEYVPDSTAADGTPRYGNAHPMWVDFQAGIINPITGTVREDFILVAPIPVDTAGELLDPIAAGVVNESSLDKQRIDDTWVYGDGGPVEEAFFDSVYYPFTVALASYLMKNGIWTDTVWTEVFIEIGLNAPNQIFNAPHLVHRQTLTRPSLADLPVHLETDDDGTTVQRVGVNAWISEVVQINGGSVDTSFGSLLRNTQPALSWRASGFINGDRTIVRTLSGKEVPFEDVHVVLHQSQPVRESFASGVLITRENPGYRVYGYDTFNPMFTAEVPAVPVVGGQVVLTEESIAEEDQHVFTTENLTLPIASAPAVDTAGFAVMINGIPIKRQHIKINSKTEYEIEPIVRVAEGDIVSVQIITTQSNPSTQTKTFYTNQGVAFPYYAKGTGEFVNVEYGRFFGSSIEVVNFLIGYGRYLRAEGWEFPDASPDGADQLDYFYVAKLFAEWVVDVESPWNPNPQTPPEDRGVFQASPFSAKAVFSTNVGQTLNVEAIQNGAYGLVNQYGNPIPTDETVVSRVGPTMTVEAVADSEIYGCRALITEIEHVVFFSNVTEFNDLMYDPPSAQAHETLRVDTYRSSNWNGRLEADGFIINGGELLPNFEKQAKDAIKLYDRYDVVDDPEKYNQAKNLYGWYPADEYMDPIDADERSRFDYYRGMVKAKGSRRAFKAYWRGTRLGTDNIFLYEEWAWLLARFGDTRREEPQFRVGKNDFRKEVQVVRFVDEDDDQNTILEVTPYNRNLDPIDGSAQDIENRTGNGRWVRPPVIDDDNDGISNIEFPVNELGVPDPNTKFYAKLFEESTLFNIQNYFHYDPALERYEPTAMANIDYITIADPARYNNGPDAVFSGGRIWTEDRVGDLWWNVRRNTYSDYRNLLPDYENAASQWGRLEFFNAIIERTDETVTLTTLDPFTPYLSDGTPNSVQHGLAIGQKVDIIGAQPEDYNQEQIEVAYEIVSVTGTDMANTNEAVGITDFTVTEASGATDAPTFQAGDGCIIETRSGTQPIVLETGGILDDVIREINTILTLDEVQATNINGRLGFTNTPSNAGSWFTLREDAYIIGCTPTLSVTSGGDTLEDIEFIQSSTDLAGGAYVGVNVDNATNIIDDLRVVQNIVGDTIVEATCSGGHFLVLGDEVTISGATPAGYNGTFIVDQQVGDNTFQFKNAAAFGLGPATGSITYTVSDPSDERFAQNIVIAINRQTTDFYAEYLGTNTFRFCTMLPRATASSTTATFTWTAGGIVNAAGGDFTLSQPESEYIDLLTTRAGFTLGATTDPDVVERTYPFDKTLVGSISTQSGTVPFALNTATDWSLDGVVDLINALGIVEVQAIAANGFLTIQSTEDYPGASFLLDGTFFTAAGVDTSFLYGDFPPDSGMVFQVGTKSVEFVSTGGTLDAVVAEMNSFFLAESIFSIEAVNDENRLTIRNTENFQGSEFAIQQPITASISIPDLIGITTGPYSPDPTKIVYTINGEPDTPATGVPQVIVGFIDLYEWVRSPVPPSEWENYTASLTAPDAPNGTPLNVDNASYVTVDTILSTGATETTYYFWVEKNSGTNPSKDYTTEELRQRMQSPISVGLPWFSPVDASTMVVYTANQKVVDGNGIELIFDTREFETHFEWALYAEGSLFKEAPQEIIDKLIDSMSGVNSQGDAVPDPKLAASERYGSLFVPIQTVFPDVESAKDVWLEAINRIFRRRNFAAEERLDAIFRVDGSGNPTEAYWSKAYYVEEAYENEEVYDTVPTQLDRDERALAGLYAVGDVVQLNTTQGADEEYRDLWDPSLYVGARYVYNGNAEWTVIGIEDYTVELNDTLFSDVDEFRVIYYAGYSILDTGEKNDLIMTVLYEMVRQNNPCEWFFKTSYIQSQMFQDIFASPFVRANEFDAVISNIQDVKPYRTKLRSDQVTTTLREIEDVPVNIFEFPDKKITLTFDRLNCNPAEDGGWDGFPWDLEPLGYDVPIWEMEDLGRGEFYLVDELVADASTQEWILTPDAAPALYDTRVEVYLSGELVEEEDWPTTVTVTTTMNDLTVQTGVVLPVGYTINVYLSWGFVEGSEPTLGLDLEDTLFQVTESTYEHHVARRIGFDTPAFRYSYARTKKFIGDGATASFSPGMDVDQVTGFIDVYVIGTDGNAVKQEFGVDYTITSPGTIAFNVAPPAPPTGWEDGNIYCYLTCNPSVEGNIETLPQERIQPTVLDSVSICVKTFNTEAYGMWDHTPWDTSPWDSPPSETAPKSHIILVGNEETIAPGIEILQTSDDIPAVDAPYVFAPSDRFGILAVYVQIGGVGPFTLATEGVDYDFYQDFDHIIEFAPAFGLAPADVVRLVYGRWFTGKLGSFQITSTPVPLDYEDQNMVATVEPPENDTITVEYIFERRGPQPQSMLSGVENVVAEMVDDIGVYNNPDPQTFDETAFLGMRVLDTTLDQIFVYNTTGTYTVVMSVPVGYTFYVTRTQEIWQFDGSNYNKLFEVGDSSPSPPVLAWPPFGIGVTHGPYYLGTAPGADVQWPEAKQIMDAEGECTEFESPDYGTPDDL